MLDMDAVASVTAPGTGGDVPVRSTFVEIMQPHIRSAPQQIASAVYRAILDGSLAPGTRLPSEDELADIFCVSRPTVSRALQRLKSSGVIRSSRGRGRGKVVVGVGPRALTAGSRAHIDLALGDQEVTNEQLREVRYELELLSAATAALRHTVEDLADLDRNEAIRPGCDGVPLTLESALRYDLAFHRILARSSHNPLISSFVSATIITYRSFDVGEEHRTPDQIIAHLDDVLAAVRARDGRRARTAMERHLLASGGPCRDCTLRCDAQDALRTCWL